MQKVKRHNAVIRAAQHDQQAPQHTQRVELLGGRRKKENPEATLSFRGWSKRVRLTNVRLALVLMNLVVLAAAGVSYFSWLDAKFNWQLSNADRPGRNILKALDSLPPLPSHVHDTIAGVHMYLDQMLYLTAFNLFLYWLVYGVVVSCRFGDSCGVWTIVMSVPHTVMMIIWEIGAAIAILKVCIIVNNLPWELIQFANDKHYTDLRYLQEFYLTWGPWISSLYILCAPVQIILLGLPFFLNNLPYQGNEKQLKPVNSTIKDSEPEKESLKTRGSAKMQAVYRELKTRLIGPARREQQQVQLVSSISRRTDSELGPDYVGMEDISVDTNNDEEEVSSLYHCEMPHEKIEKDHTQKMFSRVRRVSWRGGSAGRAVINTMSRVYHVHNSGRPLWSLLDTRDTPHPRLLAGDRLAGGVSIYGEHNDYIHMWPSPPPPYTVTDPNSQASTDPIYSDLP